MRNQYISDEKRTIRLAGHTICVTSCPNYIDQLFSDFKSDLVEKPEISLSVPKEILEDAHIKMREKYLNTVLLEQLFEELFRRRIAIIHASSFCFRGEAVILLGASGSGKSTLAQLFCERYPEEVTMINDDHPFLRFDSDEIIVCDSPWKGKHKRGSNIEAPLKRIFLLEKSDHDLVRPVSKAEAIKALISAFEYLPKDVSDEYILNSMLTRLMEKSPIARCTFSKSPEAAETLHNALISQSDAKDILSPALSGGDRPDISVIVPVCNPGEVRMRQCLDSLLSQTQPVLEFIFVDDRGTDSSMDLVREAAESDTRVRIIANSRNLGPGKSRNKAIEEARGRYLSFIDADDYVQEVFFREMYRVALARDADIVKPLRVGVLEKSDGSTERINDDMEYVERILHLREKGDPLVFLFMNNHTGALFSRRLTDEPSVRFGETVCSEDFTFLLRACKIANSFFFADKARYCCRMHKGSLSSRADERRISDQLSALREQLDILDNMNVRTDAYYQAVCLMILRVLQLHLKLCSMGLNEAADALLSELREIVMLRPDRDELCDRFPEIDILCRYRRNLCKTPDYTSTYTEAAAVRTRILEHWAAFAEEHPEEIAALEMEYRILLKESEMFCARCIAYGRDDDFSIPDYLAAVAKCRRVLQIGNKQERI